MVLLYLIVAWHFESVKSIKPNPFHAAQLKKLKKAEENRTSVEIFLKALDRLAQYHELLANKGQLLVVYEGSDEPPVEFDFD